MIEALNSTEAERAQSQGHCRSDEDIDPHLEVNEKPLKATGSELQF